MTNHQVQADLAKVASEYRHSHLQQEVLENYKESILMLRAKSASYEKIASILGEHGIRVSVATVRKFCRKHDHETERLRTHIEAGIEMSSSSADRTTVSAHEQRPSLTSEPGKRGPRPARDQL